MSEASVFGKHGPHVQDGDSFPLVCTFYVWWRKSLWYNKQRYFRLKRLFVSGVCYPLQSHGWCGNNFSHSHDSDYVVKHLFAQTVACWNPQSKRRKLMLIKFAKSSPKLNVRHALKCICFGKEFAAQIRRGKVDCMGQFNSFEDDTDGFVLLYFLNYSKPSVSANTQC